MPGSNGRPPACKARADAAVCCRLSLKPFGERWAAPSYCALLRFAASRALPHASESRLLTTTPGRRARGTRESAYNHPQGKPAGTRSAAVRGDGVAPARLAAQRRRRRQRRPMASRAGHDREDELRRQAAPERDRVARAAPVDGRELPSAGGRRPSPRQSRGSASRRGRRGPREDRDPHELKRPRGSGAASRRRWVGNRIDRRSSGADRACGARRAASRSGRRSRCRRGAPR